MAPSRIEQFEKLHPAFVGFGWGELKDIAEKAYQAGAIEISASLRAGNTSPKVSADGMLAGRSNPSNWSMRHGHLPSGATGIASELSGACPYQLHAQFSGDTLENVQLTLFLLNPRLICAEKAFIPAEATTSNEFKRLLSSGAPCGFAFQSDPTIAPADRFSKLKEGLPQETLDISTVPNGFVPFDHDTLVSRLDFRLTWTVGTAANVQQDAFGHVIGIPSVEAPRAIIVSRLSLFSPSLSRYFNGLCFTKGIFGVRLVEDSTSGPVFILQHPKKPGTPGGASEADWELYRKAVTEFGLTDDFKGLLFKGVEVHLLDDSGFGNGISTSVGLSALSFGSGVAAGRTASWYTSFEAKWDMQRPNSFFGMFTGLSLRAVLGESEPRSAILTGKFRDNLDFPYKWLEKRAVAVTARKQKWKDTAGAEQESWLWDIGIEGEGDAVLARINPKTQLEKSIAVAFTLAPVVLATGSLDVHGQGVPPGPDSRAYFADIRSGDSMAQVYAAAALGWFFSEAINIREIRVVGAKVQIQPAILNDAGATGNDTALLFDYETDFSVAFDSKFKTARDIRTRVDGTGIVIGDKFRWVQVPSGVRELALADPGLWELGALGKILKIAEVSLRRDPRKELLLKLRLNGNLGMVTAGDFLFAVDLQDATGLRMEAFPSRLSLEIPSLKGTGVIVINKGGSDIAGSIDLQLLSSGLRIFGGVRVAKPDAKSKKNVTAVMATARVIFPTMIPLASSGLGLRGLEGLYASHFERKEDPPKPAVPSALQWLKDVEGDVVKSITDFPEKWQVAYDHWSFGIGVILGIQGSNKLLNINGMFVLELPGPRIIVFAKVNLLKDHKSNKEVKDELDVGVLGLLEINIPKKEITLAALAELKFASYLSFRAPIELFFSIQRLSSWHVYIGHFDNPITAKLDIAGIANLNASAYFMSAGDFIKNAPLPGGRKDLPGFAVALGSEAHVKIGGGSLYLRVDFKNYLFVSLSDTLYAIGGVAISGELRLFIVSVGAYGTFDFEFVRRKDETTSLYVRGAICGSVDFRFFSVSGCVTLLIGGTSPNTAVFPMLVGGVKLVAGTDVALHGQGVLGPIDAVVGVAADLSISAELPTGIPLDAAIAVSMEAAPRVAQGAAGFASKVIHPAEKETEFRIGARQGHYVLNSARLWLVETSGNRIEHASSPATWWKSAQSPDGGQPIPRELALLTRNPLAANNSVVSDEDLKAWIDAVLGGICDPAIKPQSCMYMWGRADLGEGNSGSWSLPALLPNPAIEQKIGRTGATASLFQMDKRAGFGTPNDQLIGVPAIAGGCIALSDPETDNPVPVLHIVHREVFDQGGMLHPVTSTAHLRADILPLVPLDIILGHALKNQLNAVDITIKLLSGQTTTFPLGDRAKVKIDDLTDPLVQADYHRNSANWEDHVEAFARLAGNVTLAGTTFVRAQIDLSSFSTTDHPVEIKISFNNSLESRSDANLFIGASKFVPFAELARYQSDERHRQDTIDSLTDFLQSPEIPLLEPKSKYELEMGWSTIGDGEPPRTKIFGFITTFDPPSSAASQLLTVFPQAGERFHYLDDKPGFALASSDLFRMLIKFPRARIKVTITEDAGNIVKSSDGTVNWTEGRIVDPKALIDPLNDPPTGFIRDSIASLPSALREALREKIASGELACLGSISVPNSGLWIGFDAVLRPISGYAIKLEIVYENGKAWKFKEERPNRGDDPFLGWRFQTGLYKNLDEFAARLRTTARHRILEQALDLPANLPGYEELGNIGTLPDKGLEDALFSALGERPDRTFETAITVLWHREPSGLLKAHSILIESNEPLVRFTEAVKIEQRKGGVLTAEKTRQLLQAPDSTKSVGFSGFKVSSNGCSVIAQLDPSLTDNAKLVVSQRLIDRVSRSIHPDITIDVEQSVLAPRPAEQE